MLPFQSPDACQCALSIEGAMITKSKNTLENSPQTFCDLKSVWKLSPGLLLLSALIPTSIHT